MSISTFKILCYPRKNYLNKSKQAGIMVHIIVDEKLCQFRTNKVSSQRLERYAICRSVTIVQINNLLDEVKSSFHT